ncbi:MAG: DUF5752 family protein [Acidobacteriota bacterium]|nr:DUF5752 family protein [Acidobacteriota bacterium]
MATTLSTPVDARTASTPFYFNSESHLTRIGRERATNLVELLEGLKSCPDASIFYHTFQTLREHHYLRAGFSNDFAQWVFAACNEVGLAERLAVVDVRDFTSIPEIRSRIVGAVESYLKANPMSGARPAFEPFYFCASETVVTPTPFAANTLEEFAECLQQAGLHSIHHHFITARLRPPVTRNDFSTWLEAELGLTSLAARLNRIDIYTSTLSDVRRKIVQLVQQEITRSTP